MPKSPILILFLFLFTFPFVVIAQGPPPQAQAHAQKEESDDKGPPFASTEKIMDRFQKEFGVPVDVFKKVSADLAGQDQFRGETTQEKASESGSEKVRSNTEIVLLLAVTQVNLSEKKGTMKKENRTADLLSSSNQIMQEMMKSKEGWGPIAMSTGFTDPGELLAIKRAIDWGKPVPPELLQKMGM